MKNLKSLAKAMVGTAVFWWPLFALASNAARTYEQLFNPLPSNELFCPTAVCDLTQMFLLIIRDFLQLLPIASVLFIIIGGFQMVASSGNEERLARAKRTVLWAILGLVIGILSFSIIAITQDFLKFNS